MTFLVCFRINGFDRHRRGVFFNRHARSLFFNRHPRSVLSGDLVQHAVKSTLRHSAEDPR